MQNIESVSKSIQSKRRAELDSQDFLMTNLILSTYDIRKNRGRNAKLKEDLARDGQLQPLTISVVTGEEVGTVVNGRTRYIEMCDLPDLFKTVKVEVYENLNELEQNYLNAQINISQNPLTPDEKREFIIRHKNEISIEEMAKALGLGMEMFKNYMATTKVSDKVLKAWTPKSEGHGRGTVKIEELGKAIRAYEKKGGNVSKKVLNETFEGLGKMSESSDLKRDEKRIQFPKVVEKVAEMQKNPSVTKKYDTATIIKSASKEVLNAHSNGTSGDKLPQNSSEKYKIVDGLLEDTYDFAVLLFAEGLYRTDENGNSVESETKRVIDKVNQIIVVGNELEKLTEIEDYAISLKKKIVVVNDDVIEACEGLLKDNRHGFIYVNGASLYSQRPEFMNYLKKKYSNSVIAVVVLDLLFGKSNVYQGNVLKERITVYEGAENFAEVLAEYKKRVPNVTFKKYADTPQEKYIVFI
jgi:hypothetical protein